MCDVVPEEAILLRSAYLRNNIKALALVAEGKRHARKLTDRAEQEAESVYQRAREDGFAKGMLSAVDAIVGYLADHAKSAAQLQSALEEQIALLLGRCVNDPDVVMATLEECLESRDACHGARLDLLLPESFRTNHRQVLAMVQKQFSGLVNIEYRDGTRFLMRIGDQVAEFSPDDFVERASDHVMGALPSVFSQSRSLAEACRERLAAKFGLSGEETVITRTSLKPQFREH